MLNLRDRVKQLSQKCEVMEGREKGKNIEIENKIVTLNNYDFMEDENGKPYVVYTVKEFDDLFFFGGSVLTNDIKELDKDGYKSQIQEEGLPIRITECQSKKGRKYFNVEYYPENK